MATLNTAQLTTLTGSSSSQQVARALTEFAFGLEQFARDVNNAAGSIVDVSAALFADGIPGPNLQPGLLCYPSGALWLPANGSDASKYARGACLRIRDGRAVIQMGLRMPVRVTEAVNPGDLLYLSQSRAGHATKTAPADPTTGVLQEVGAALSDSHNGVADVFVILRIQPEAS